jgi:hypothetical protein
LQVAAVPKAQVDTQGAAARRGDPLSHHFVL